MSTSSIPSSTVGSLSTQGGSAPLQITGLASGLDTNTIIRELMSIEQQPVNRLQNQSTGLSSLNTQLTGIQSALSTVAADAQALGSPTLFATSQTVTSSAPGQVSAATSTGAGVGGYQVGVSQLANSAQRTFTYASPTSAGSITIDGHSTSIAAGESIQDFVSSINADSGATVYAAATDSGTVVLSERATGDTGSSFVQVAGAGGMLTEQTGKARAGQDALYTVDGVAGSSSSNTVAGAIPGVTLTLSGVTTTSGPATVNVTPPAVNTASISSALQTFITDYNTAIGKIQVQVAETPSATNPTQGTLFGDPQLNSLLSSMRSAMYASGSGLAAGMASMADIGVSTGATTGAAAVSNDSVAGVLTLSASKLTSALQSNPAGVQQVLQSWSSGFASLLNSAAEPGGSLDGRIQGDTARISVMGQEISSMQATLADKKAQLTSQFALLEGALSRNQSTSSWLTSQLAALPVA